MRIEIKYHVDSDKFTDAQFDDEPQRVLIIDKNNISDVIREFGVLKSDEFLSEFEFEINTKP